MHYLFLSTLLALPALADSPSREPANAPAKPQRVRMKGRSPSWSDVKTVEDIQVRLSIDDHATSAVNGARIAYAVLEVRNVGRPDSTYADVRLKNLKLQVFNSVGNPLKEAGLAFRRQLPNLVRGGRIPSKCYLGVLTYNGGVSTGAKRAVFVVWRQTWDLPAGTYMLKGTLEGAVNHHHPKGLLPWKKVRLKLVPVKFVVPN